MRRRRENFFELDTHTPKKNGKIKLDTLFNKTRYTGFYTRSEEVQNKKWHPSFIERSVV